MWWYVCVVTFLFPSCFKMAAVKWVFFTESVKRLLTDSHNILVFREPYDFLELCFIQQNDSKTIQLVVVS